MLRFHCEQILEKINKLEENDYCIECESLYGESCYSINFDKLSVKYLLTNKKYPKVSANK